MVIGQQPDAGNRPAEAVREFEKAKQLLPGAAGADKPLRAALTQKNQQDYGWFAADAANVKRWSASLASARQAGRPASEPATA